MSAPGGDRPRDVQQPLPRDVQQPFPRDVQQPFPRDVQQPLPRAATTMASAGAEGVRDRSVAAVGVASAPPAPSGAGTSVRRRRPREAIAVGEVTRGAPAEVLLSPAGEVLGAMPWSGASPDPDVLDAVTFLAWL